MLKMLVCPKCKAIYSAEEGAKQSCPDCKIEIVPIGISKDNWSRLSADQKNNLREIALTNAPQIPAEQVDAASAEDRVNVMQADIHTIKNILVFYLVASILAAILIIIRLA